MSTDLSEVIRDALHADEITISDLRYPELRAPRRRLPGFVAVIAAAASVAAIAAVLVTVTWKGDDDGGGGGVPAAGGGFTDVLGYQWRVTGLVDAAGELSVPDAHGAMIGYTHHGYVGGDDSVNSLGGNYEATATGYSVTDSVTTLVGFVGGDPDRKRVIGAVDAMFFAVAAPGDATPTVEVAVSLAGDTLTLTSAGTTLTLARAGEQPELSTEASATPSPEGSVSPTPEGSVPPTPEGSVSPTPEK